MRLLHANLHKTLCALLVALAFVTLPLPALADNEPQAAQTTTETSTAAPATTLDMSLGNDTAPAEVATQPTQAQFPADQSPANTSPTTPQQATNSVNPVQPVTGSVENNVNSETTSGSATVTQNEEAGDAASGGASAFSTTVNVANTNGASAGSFQTFECNINDDREENILIDPLALPGFCQSTIAGSSAQPSAPGQGLQTGSNLTEILNNIVLTATSGNAAVTGNETAGNATSGSAAALANVLNIANTSINSSGSFLGVINIYGDLKGDILVPQSLVDGLVGKTGSATATNGTTTTTITNNLDASAQSGNATVANNGTAGNAASGNAMTSLTVLNLTGQEVVAKNSLLVFINVLGKWMGVIVPAPNVKNASGTAMLGSGLQSNVAALPATNSGGDTTTAITNNISVSAQSGNATVTDNETAGNATSGNAGAGVNLLNITNSNFRLDDWFGALFINVLGSWLGDFDIQASAPTATSDDGAGNPEQVVQAVQIYKFEEPATVAPADTAAARPVNTASAATVRQANDISTTTAPAGAVLGTSTVTGTPDKEGTKAGVKLDIFALSAVVLALTTLIATSGFAVRNWYSS